MPIIGRLACYCQKEPRFGAPHASIVIPYNGPASLVGFVASLVGRSKGWICGESDRGLTRGKSSAIKVMCPACVDAMPDFPSSDLQQDSPCRSSD